jgi:hypothetical protein
MNKRNLVILLAFLAVLAGLAVLKHKRSAPSVSTPDKNAALLGKLDINDVTRFTVEAASQTITVVKSGEGWIVESRWNYRADFNNVVEWLRKFAEAKAGQLVRGAESHLAEFGLAPSTNAAAGEGLVTFRFFGGAKEPLAVLDLGKGRSRPGEDAGQFGGFPDSQYVRANGGPVMLVKEHFGQAGARAADWLDRTFPAVDRDKVAEVVVTPATGGAYRIFQPSNGAYTAENVATNEEVKSDQASTLVGALSWLRVSDVAGPAGQPAAFGLDKPSVFSVKTREGFTYTIRKGAATNDGCFGQLEVAYAKPPPPPPGASNVVVKPTIADAIAATTNANPGAAISNVMAAASNAVPVDPMKVYEDKCVADEKKAKEEQAKYGAWIYVFDMTACNNFTMPRTQVIAPKPPPATNEAPGAAAASAAPPLEFTPAPPPPPAPPLVPPGTPPPPPISVTTPPVSVPPPPPAAAAPPAPTNAPAPQTPPPPAP